MRANKGDTVRRCLLGLHSESSQHSFLLPPLPVQLPAGIGQRAVGPIGTWGNTAGFPGRTPWLKPRSRKGLILLLKLRSGAQEQPEPAALSMFLLCGDSHSDPMCCFQALGTHPFSATLLPTSPGSVVPLFSQQCLLQKVCLLLGWLDASQVSYDLLCLLHVLPCAGAPEPSS